MAETALHQLDLDQVIWVPSRRPPHKSRLEVFDIAHRLAMLQRAIADQPAFVLSEIELKSPGLSYAINTLIDLKLLYPNSQWYWIIGLDAFQSLPQWYRSQEVALQCHWLVAPRLESLAADNVLEAGSKAGSWEDMIQAQLDARCQQVVQQMAAQSIRLCWQALAMPWVTVSSSLIRQYCRDRRSIRYLVPEAVRTYIADQKLYQGHQDS